MNAELGEKQKKTRDKSKLMMKNDQRNRKKNRTQRMNMEETTTKRIEMANEKDKRAQMDFFSLGRVWSKREANQAIGMAKEMHNVMKMLNYVWNAARIDITAINRIVEKIWLLHRQ